MGVLDLGCGDGRLTGELAAAGADVRGADPSTVALERAREAYPEIRFDAVGPGGALPYEDAEFDAVACIHVLQHVQDTQGVMSEARRVLRPGGTLAIVVPHHGRVRNATTALFGFERHFDPLEPVVRFYTRRSLEALLNQFGLDEVRVRGAGGMPLLRRLLCATARRP
jgi:ubiquinone/menaquinone biosynthesis C-methylase UbiE